MIALRVRSPKGAEQRLELAPGHHTAGGAARDTLKLDGLPGSVLEIDSSDRNVIVVARIAGIALGPRVLKAGERWLLRGGQSLIVRGYEIHRRADAAAPAQADGTAALARGLLGGALGAANAPSPLPTLIWLNGRDCGKRLPLLDEATFLGRGDGTGARVRDALASRAHAKLVVKDGAAQLLDLSSANGVCVDGARVEQQRDLWGGEVIRIGETELLFEAALARSVPPPAPADARCPPSATASQPNPAPARRGVGFFELAVIGAASATGAAVTAAVWLLAR
jgi:hypothetical protein